MFKFKSLAIVSLSLLSTLAFADQSVSCKFGTAERVITVVYAEQDKKVPCEVSYQKDDISQTPWSAQNLAGYCEQKADELVQKQIGWGWACDNADAFKMEETAAE